MKSVLSKKIYLYTYNLAGFYKCTLKTHKKISTLKIKPFSINTQYKYSSRYILKVNTKAIFVSLFVQN